MTRRSLVGIVLALTASWGTLQTVSAGGGRQDAPAASAALAAAKASPEIVGALSKEIGATPEQAAGAAGALFGVAKSRLTPSDFSQIEKAVPGMDALLKAAPALGGGAMSQLAGAAGGLTTAAASFTKLGLTPEMVAKAVPVLTAAVTKAGGSSVGNLLAGALK